jgi:hypothetical protein
MNPPGGGDPPLQDHAVSKSGNVDFLDRFRKLAFQSIRAVHLRALRNSAGFYDLSGGVQFGSF